MSDDIPSSAEIVKSVTEGTVAALIEPITTFLDRLVGPAADQLGGWAGDFVEIKRAMSRVRMLAKAKAQLDAAGLTPQQVPLPVLSRILESGPNEDDESMADRWAALLANAAADPARVPPSFPAILEQLSPTEAALLDAIFTEAYGTGVAVPGDKRIIDVGTLGTGLDDSQLAVATENLLRQRLCTGEQLNVPGGIVESTARVFVTDLGKAFVRQCRLH